ncbi:hypothetical protein [Fischerella sp.]|nr:hypothetical protein [Fischerella sp.]
MIAYKTLAKGFIKERLFCLRGGDRSFDFYLVLLAAIVKVNSR